MVEYIPGKYAYRPVEAKGYMFINCIFVGFKKEFKGQGIGTSMVEECIKDAREKDMKGVAVVSRKGSFMAKKDIFEKIGFVEVDKAKPDFQLMVLKFNKDAGKPKFRDLEENLKEYKEKELVIMRSVQCPYTEKNVNSIVKTANEEFDLDVELTDLEDHNDIQKSPCAFGVFCIIYKGEIISYHPISDTRFRNIINKRLESK
jgi:predicted GNAT family acetyltransferase